jgi:hypothetical protein
MPREQELVEARNKQILADYRRLISQEYPLTVHKIKLFVRLNYTQVIQVLAQSYFLKPRTIEPIITKAAKDINLVIANK